MVEVTLPIKPFQAQWPRVVLAGVVLLVVMFVGFLILIYKFPDTALGRMVTAQYPFPLVMIGQEVAVTTRGLSENRAALRHFYESQDFAGLGMRVDFTTEDGQKRLKIRERDLINKMFEDKVIELFAARRGITVTDEQVAAETTVKMKELGTTDKVEETLARLYDWSITDFQTQIVRPAMYEEALVAVYESEVDQTVAKNKILEAEQALKTQQVFAEVAKTFSEGETRANGGALGWFRLEDLAPELRGPVDVAKLNVPTKIIESPLGYHILLVEETKLEEATRLYQIRQIFMRKVSFADWLASQIRGLSVTVLSQEYEWRRDEAHIDFRSEEMRAFEKKTRENAEGDPTLVF